MIYIALSILVVGLEAIYACEKIANKANPEDWIFEILAVSIATIILLVAGYKSLKSLKGKGK